jgi:hypothetical protein
MVTRLRVKGTMSNVKDRMFIVYEYHNVRTFNKILSCK